MWATLVVELFTRPWAQRVAAIALFIINLCLTAGSSSSLARAAHSAREINHGKSAASVGIEH
jgi:hypothetical protein